MSFDELIKIDGQARRDDAEVRAEVEGRGDGERCFGTIRVLLVMLALSFLL